MMTGQPVLVSTQWLARREPADAAARATDLVALISNHRPPSGDWVIYDLGAGTGSMARWVAPQLSGGQRWILYDRDPDLLAHARTPGPAAADGAAVSLETRTRDITRLGTAELAGATLITASALLDMLTAAELDRLVRACAGAGCPVLIALSVTGRVDLTPPDPLDGRIAAAFNAHQRRSAGGRQLLGPDAVGATVEAFARLGRPVQVRQSPWRLRGADAELVAEWLRGWLAAAVEQEPDLGGPIVSYAQRRLQQATTGQLGVVVQHDDLLALPR